MCPYCLTNNISRLIERVRAKLAKYTIRSYGTISKTNAAASSHIQHSGPQWQYGGRHLAKPRPWQTAAHERRGRVQVAEAEGGQGGRRRLRPRIRVGPHAPAGAKPGGIRRAQWVVRHGAHLQWQAPGRRVRVRGRVELLFGFSSFVFFIYKVVDGSTHSLSNQRNDFVLVDVWVYVYGCARARVWVCLCECAGVN